MRRLWSVTLGTIIAVVLTVLAAGTASAHANLISSVPADGVTVPTAPAQITMNFTEPPDPTLSVVDVLGAGGNVLPGVGKPTLQPPKTLTVSLPPKLPDGVYTVSWRVASSTDGHVTAGSFAFGVGASTTVTPVGSSSSSAYGPTPLSVGAKTALYVGLMLLVAVAVVGLGAFGGDPTSLRIVGLIGAGVALVGAAGLLVAEQRTVGVPMNQLLRTATGRPYVWLLIVVLAADALAVVGAAKDRWRRVFWGAGAAAALAMWIRSANGHAAAAPTPIAQELLQWLHFLAAGVWVGGLLLLVLLLFETGPCRADGRRRSARASGDAVLDDRADRRRDRRRDRQPARGRRAGRPRQGPRRPPNDVRLDPAREERARARGDRPRRA